ncbi:MAG: DUF2934 domain-containing protein [Gammaproteobacteria bacterium]|nr:DUF2934 domain-containing protein [Gammaproteobacteria bacterium]
MSTAEVVTGTGTAARTALGRLAGATSQDQTATRKADRKPAEAAPCISPEERVQMISEAAYFRAEQRGFMVGDDLADWLAAESDIDALLLGSDPAQSSK